MNILNFPKAPKLHLKVFNQHHLLLSEYHKEFYQKSYESWKQVWQDVESQEMGLPHSYFYSDDFTRQDHIISLFTGTTCIGLAFMREVNLNINCIREDSAFRFWPPEELDQLKQKYSKLIIATSFTITQEFRRTNIEWKTLFLSLFLDYFGELHHQIMITAARKIKSNEKLCYQLGGMPLRRDVPFKTKSGQSIRNEIADLLYWKKNNFSLADRELELMRKNIWASYSKEKRNDKILSA